MESSGIVWFRLVVSRIDLNPETGEKPIRLMPE
jgi:hypothetical protein